MFIFWFRKTKYIWQKMKMIWRLGRRSLEEAVTSWSPDLGTAASSCSSPISPSSIPV
jgi:hypothetical protein